MERQVIPILSVLKLYNEIMKKPGVQYEKDIGY